jgi:putative oxidoreductase
MGTILRLNRWANAHTNIGFDVLRVALGAFIFYKGVFFFAESNSAETYRMLAALPGSASNMIIVHILAMAHICGGILIALGMITRLAVAVQIPILTAAVIANSIGAANESGLLQSGFCLAICLFFLFYGSGKHSVDYSLKMHM